jgi:hypothetical protein
MAYFATTSSSLLIWKFCADAYIELPLGSLSSKANLMFKVFKTILPSQRASG